MTSARLGARVTPLPYDPKTPVYRNMLDGYLVRTFREPAPAAASAAATDGRVSARLAAVTDRLLASAFTRFAAQLATP